MKAYVLKAAIREQGCELQRIGRSRNWQLKANFEQLQAIISVIECQDEASWLWIAKLLRQQFQQLTHDSLLGVARKLNHVTINSLMAHTDCTIAQARKVIDELEGLD